MLITNTIAICDVDREVAPELLPAVTWQSYRDIDSDRPTWDGTPDLAMWRTYQAASKPAAYVLPTVHIDPKYAAKCSKKIKLNAGVDIGKGTASFVSDLNMSHVYRDDIKQLEIPPSVRRNRACLYTATIPRLKPRRITNEELADLSDNWENPTVDTSKYYQNVLRAYECDRETYLDYKADGGLCQVHNGRYYIA